MSASPTSPAPKPADVKQAYLQLHTSVFLFGFTAIFGALISLPSAPLVWWRLVFTVPVFVVYLVWRRQWRWLPWRDTYFLFLE